MAEIKLNKNELKALHGTSYVSKFEKNKAIYDLRLKGILKHIQLKKNEIIADYGCGNGQLFEFIHDGIGQYFGIDFSEAFIEAFKKKLDNKNFKIEPALFCEDINEFVKHHINKFDKAFTLDFSEHIYDEDFISIYSSIHRSLKPNGELILHTPNGNFFLEWMRNHGWLKQRKEHIAVRNAKEYTKLLNKIGFNHVEIIYIPHYNILRCLHPLSDIPFIGKVFQARLLIKCMK